MFKKNIIYIVIALTFTYLLVSRYEFLLVQDTPHQKAGVIRCNKFTGNCYRVTAH
jgi:hypothetical protein